MRSVRVRRAACVRLRTRVFLRALMFHFCLRVRARLARAHGYSGRAEDGGKFGSCASARKTLSMTGCVPYPPLSGVAGTPARACGHSFRVLLSREGVLQRRPCRPRRSALLGLRLRSVGCLCLRAVPHCCGPCCPGLSGRVVVCVCRRRHAALHRSLAVLSCRCAAERLCGRRPRCTAGTYVSVFDRSANAVNSVSVPSGSRSGCGLPPGLARLPRLASLHSALPSGRLLACLFACLLVLLRLRLVCAAAAFVCLFVWVLACVRACLLRSTAVTSSHSCGDGRSIWLREALQILSRACGAAAAQKQLAAAAAAYARSTMRAEVCPSVRKAHSHTHVRTGTGSHVCAGKGLCARTCACMLVTDAWNMSLACRRHVGALAHSWLAAWRLSQVPRWDRLVAASAPALATSSPRLAKSAPGWTASAPSGAPGPAASRGLVASARGRPDCSASAARGLTLPHGAASGPVP